MTEIQEDDYCPNISCEGKMYFPPVENCSCHIMPPCGRCVDNEIECNTCHWKPGDEIYNPIEELDQEITDSFGLSEQLLGLRQKRK